MKIEKKKIPTFNIMQKRTYLYTDTKYPKPSIKMIYWQIMISFLSNINLWLNVTTVCIDLCVKLDCDK